MNNPTCEYVIENVTSGNEVPLVRKGDYTFEEIEIRLVIDGGTFDGQSTNWMKVSTIA